MTESITLRTGEVAKVTNVVAEAFRDLEASVKKADAKAAKAKFDTYEREKALRAARRQLDAEEAQEKAAELQNSLPAPVCLTALLAEDQEDEEFIVDRLLAEDGRALFVAARKTGKTTARDNLVRSLADGEPFLGHFAAKAMGRIVVIDIEMSRRQIRRWMDDQGVRKTNAVEVLSLRGKAATFNIMNPTVRAFWASVLKDADVVILDCLRPILDGLGLNENTDAGQFLMAFDALLDEADARAAVVIHHAGHANDRARGDSRLEDWADALWYMSMGDRQDPASDRKFRAQGRDVEVAEGGLEFDPDTRHLTYVAPSADNPKAAKAAEMKAKDHEARQAVREWVSGQNALGIEPTKNDVRTQVPTLFDVARKFVDRATQALLDSGELRVEYKANAHRLTTVDPLEAVPVKAPNPFVAEASDDA